MDERTLAQVLGALGLNAAELAEVDDVTIAEIPDDLDVSSLVGSGTRTVWSEDQKRIVTLRRRKLVFAHDGHLILDPETIAGECSVCRQQGRRAILTKAHARVCLRCGSLLCPQCMVVVGDEVYCPTHGRWPRIRRILLGERG